MATYLMTWRWGEGPWQDLAEAALRTARGEHIQGPWTCGRTRRTVRQSDRLFLVRLSEPKGIMASGRAVSKAQRLPSWHSGRLVGPTVYVDVEWDAVLVPEANRLLEVSELQRGELAAFNWNDLKPGTYVPDRLAIELEGVWRRHLDIARGPVRSGSAASVTHLAASEATCWPCPNDQGDRDNAPGTACGQGRLGQQEEHGAGFGQTEDNLAVERAAVGYVTARYRADGWDVTSVEGQRIGYDLRCTRGSAERHVEVKGVAGPVPSFMLTEGERHAAANDPLWWVVVVTGALGLKPRCREVTGADLLAGSQLTPLTWRVSLHPDG
jgi:hypothetical protein